MSDLKPRSYPNEPLDSSENDLCRRATAAASCYNALMHRRTTTIALAVILIPSAFFAWGRDGHHILGNIADTAAAPTQSMRSALEAPPAFHREQPDDPPGQAAKDNLDARSPVARAQRGPFDSIQVNVDEFGNNIVGDAANEPSIAIDPTDPDKIAIGWRQFDTIDSNFRQAGWGYSQDGGQSWTFPGVIEPGVFRSDPVLGFNTNGDFYYYSLTTDFGNIWECRSFKSIDGGVSWDEGVFAFGGDKAWLAVDRSWGIGHGHIYAKWQTFANCCGENTFTRSVDGGQNFEEPVPVPLGPTFGTISVGPDGAVYAAGIWAVDFQNFNRIVVARSSDAQNPAVTPTFDLAVDVELGGRLDIGAEPNPAGLAGQVWVATDHSSGPTHGNVYMLASVDPPGSDPLDVKFIRSTDGGQSWSSPIRVNDDAMDTGAWQWFGTMSVAPNGRIDAIWNDTRTAGQANISELFYAYSTDAGDTWSPNMPVSPAFDSHVGWPHQDKLGDYYDMISDVAGVRIAYAATFNGEQDVYYLRLGDCNGNDIHDGIDIANDTSDDCNDNSVPDECEPDDDCNSNGIQDFCDIANGTSEDCNTNNIPDECIDLENDCNSNLTPDECDVADGTSQDCVLTHDCCEVGHGPGCSNPQIEACVCAVDPFCCVVDWDSQCAGEVKNFGCGDCGGSGNGVPDECEPDCNDNNVPDECDIANQTSPDANGNGVPDECECPADFDGSGDVGAFDLALLLGSWGPCVGCPADFDFDGDVDAADLAALLGNWGPCE
ncbi:MAG: hypothetical protein IID41_00300 [Planctomycetes bacterium]|nr:hypothetical protein [Planctomycetota bacterium]